MLRLLTCVAFLLAGIGSARAQPLNYQDLWWAGAQENGWGLSISQQGSAVFTVLYIYDQAGRPQWVVMPQARWNTSYTSISGDLYIPTGSPYTSYDPARFVAGSPVGSATIDFASTNNAMLRYTINGASGTKAIQRQVFGDGAAIGNYTDIWWGGAAQNGWGVSMTQHGGTLVAVWYTYDAQGRTSWFVMPGASMANPAAVTGALYRTTGSAWVGATYDPGRFVPTAVGSLTFSFTDSGATMRYVVDGAQGSVDLARVTFGAVAPAATSSFQKLQQKVIAPACLSCHTAGHPYAIQSGLVLDAAVAYRNLVSGSVKLADAISRGFTRLVAPRDVASSFLYRKLALWDPADTAPLGGAMPLGTTSLTVGQLEFIRKWIEAGAPETGEVADARLLDDTTLPTYAPFAPLVVPPPDKGLQIHVEPFTVQPHFERELFVYRSLGNAAPIYVTRFESRMRPNSHHLVLYDFAPGTPAGVIPPKDIVRDIRNPDGSMNLLNMLPMAYHVFVSGAMSPNAGYTFPKGVALRLPANAALDFNVHYVNAGDTPLVGEAYANLYTTDASQVQQVASTLFLNNQDLNLPPMQRTTQTKSFTFTTQTRVLALSSHMHKRGERFVIKIKGGPRDGEVVYDNDDWDHPVFVSFEPPLTLEPGQGLTSVITYNNDTNRTITFGLTSEDEMGIIFGYTY